MVACEPYDDGWPGYEEAYALAKLNIELQGAEGELWGLYLSVRKPQNLYPSLIQHLA
jgi:hypothetical protein